MSYDERAGAVAAAVQSFCWTISNIFIIILIIILLPLFGCSGFGAGGFANEVNLKIITINQLHSL